MRIRMNVPANPAAIKAATRGLIALNRRILREQRLPNLYDSGVRYHREARNQEDWRTADEVFAAGIGDCEDLMSWRVAELQNAGEVLAGPEIVKTGFRRFHAMVRRADGRLEDPSARLGMRTR